MLDFLTFNRFATRDISIFLYYFGAIFLPVLLFYVRYYLIKKILFASEIDKQIKDYYSTLSSKNKRVIWISFIVVFVLMESFWRIIFEMIIGYFDMHDYLQEISKHRP